MQTHKSEHTMDPGLFPRRSGRFVFQRTRHCANPFTVQGSIPESLGSDVVIGIIYPL